MSDDAAPVHTLAVVRTETYVTYVKVRAHSDAVAKAKVEGLAELEVTEILTADDTMLDDAGLTAKLEKGYESCTTLVFTEAELKDSRGKPNP